jgi:hypothetical protein
MKEKIKSLPFETKANDVDEHGTVTVAVNGIGIEDSQHDISMPHSFDNTLKNDITRMRWFLNHRQDQLLGVPLEGSEKDGNLVMVGKINLNKQIGIDTYNDYKLYAANGRTLEHSIGVQALRRDKEDARKVIEWKMYEYSTLTSWGSNPQTFLVNLKSGTREQVQEAVNFIQEAFKMRGYSDERLKNYNMELNLLLKSLEGANIVTCPCCGTQFDYDAQSEVTFSQQVIDIAAMYARWITDDIVEEEMDKLEPEIRAQVTALLDSVKGQKTELTEKSITDVMQYVRCPHCYSRVYRAHAILQNTATETKEEEVPTAVKSDDFWKKLNQSFK